MTIVKAVESWEKRVDKLIEKQDENKKLKEKVGDLEREIFKIYQIVFKNLVIKRIDTEVKQNENDNRKWCLNKEGFSLLYKYSSNSDYISKFEQLKEVLKDYKSLLIYLKNSNKKKILKIFGKQFETIKSTDKKVELELDNPLELLKLKRESGKINFISYDGYSIDFRETNKGYRDYSLNLNVNGLDFNDLVVVEVFYNEINKILKNFKLLMLNMIKQKQKLFDNLKEKFSSELIFDKLKIEEK